MQRIKENWEIKENWQLIYLALGLIALILSGYYLAQLIISKFTNNNIILTTFLTVFISYGIFNITLKLFKKLYTKWKVTYRWELIAIFIVFAITGSTSARISGPLIDFLNIKETVQNNFIYWVLRILIIFPIYQFLLVIIGWVFGQFKFFWAFEKKMLRRMGLKKYFDE